MRNWFDVLWNRNDPMDKVREAFDHYWCVKAEVDGLVGEPLTNTEDVIAFVEVFRSAFKDIHFDLNDFVEHEPWITFKIQGAMIHKHTGREVTLGGCVTARVEDGKIREASNFIDFVPLMEQIGALPPNALVTSLQNQPLVPNSVA